jgi:hypothetical protein
MSRSVNLNLGIPRQVRNRLFLTPPEFEHDEAAGRDQSADIGQDRSIRIETVHAAIECPDRIVVAHLDRQSFHVAARDIGRIGDDKIEARAKRNSPVAANELRAVCDAE